MGFYDEYRPFRDYMRQFGLFPSLVDVWRYSLHVSEGELLPTDYAPGKDVLTPEPVHELVHAWELDIIARELVLNAGRRGLRSLRSWRDLADAINHVRRLDEAACICDGGDKFDVLFELHRIAHRQFPWQTKPGPSAIIRAFKVFGEAAVEKVVVRELGMNMQQFLQLGLSVQGHFRKNWEMSTSQDYGVLGISKEASTAFFERISCTMHDLRTETARRQSYGRDWYYVWNPLEARPLVSPNSMFPDRVLCPIPRYLFGRASTGIFYDLVNSGGFDNPFGSSFQLYVGEVIHATCPLSRFAVLAEDPYFVGARQMHGVDWVLSDGSGHLFIESKTKRLTVNAKTLSDTLALDKDLVVMATAIVQHYRNIIRALDAKTSWVPDSLPVYPLILTLEEWFIFSPRVEEMLSEHVSRLLACAGISEQILEDMPYTIASAHEFEIVIQVVAQVGIAALMAKKTTRENWRWALLPFVDREFKDEMRRVNWRLFADDWARLIPSKEAG